MDWKKARREYLAGGVSYKYLADKYGVSESYIAKISKKENWRSLRAERVEKECRKVADSIATERAAADSLVFHTAVQLLEAIQGSVTALTQDGALFPRSAKEFSDAVRSLQQVLDSKPTELDIEEQKARIEKLRHDYLEKNKGGSVEVILGGGLEEYGN